MSGLSAESQLLDFDLLTNHMWAVVLIIRFALWALHARLNLSSNAYTVTWLDSFDLWPDSQDLANDLVANADR